MTIAEPQSPKLRVSQASDLRNFIGQTLPPSSWRTVSQIEINRFADLTGDRQWIHVDVERAQRELPEKQTIVPGQFLLALIPALLQQIYDVEAVSSSRVARLEDVRFRQPILAGQPMRLFVDLISVESRSGIIKVDTGCALKIADDQVALTLTRTDVYF